MKNEIEILRSLFRSEDDYRRAEQWWARFWSTIPDSSSWTSPWFNTCYLDGTPMLDANPILSAKNDQLGRAFRIIQEDPDGEAGGLLVWWKQTWDPDYDNLVMLVLVIVPSIEAVKAAQKLLVAWARGDDVDDAGELRWTDE